MSITLDSRHEDPQGDEINFEYFYALYPRKVAKGAAAKAWEKLNPDAELKKEIKMSVLMQIRSRHQQESANSKIPDNRRKHIPDWPHPATWLNGCRWLDELPSTQEIRERATERKTCAQCPQSAFTERDGEALCPYHWVRKRTPEVFPAMYEQLKSMGLAKLKAETKHDYAMRCKAHVKAMDSKVRAIPA